MITSFLYRNEVFLNQKIKFFEIIFSPSDEPEEQAWTTDPEMTFESDTYYGTEETYLNEETTTTEPDPFEGLFDAPITIEVPLGEPGGGQPVNVLPANPSVEQLQEVIKSQKATCAGIIASYSCGSHNGTPTYSGATIPVKAGDELAMNSLLLTIVEIDGGGNGIGKIKMPMLNGAYIGLKLSGIQAVEGGCIVGGRAEIAEGVPLVHLDQKLKENLQTLAAALELTASVGQHYAEEIANGINYVKNAIETLKNKKENTRKLLEATDINGNITPAIESCVEISQIATSLQDSLNNVYCNVKAGKIKGLKENDLKKALEENRKFMNQLGSALAECQNTQFTPWTDLPCKGPCGEFFEVYTVDANCVEKLKAALGVASENCYYPDIHLIKQSGKKTGDKTTVQGTRYERDGMGGGNFPCFLDLYYFSGVPGSTDAKGWYKLSQFEELVKPYLKALYVIENGHNILAPQQVPTEVNQSYNLVFDWQTKGLSKEFDKVPFSNKIVSKIIDELWAKSWSGMIKPVYIEFDLALIFERPLLSLAQTLSTLGKSVALSTARGTRTAVLYYMLNTGTKKAIAKASERGVLMELEYLSGKQATYETLLELPNVKYINQAGKESSGVLRYVKDGNKYGWVEGGNVGTYTTKIKWGIIEVDARPFGKGYFGKRVPQGNPRVDAYELKISPNNESYYLPHPSGGFVQFENISNITLQDGKLVMDKSSIYFVGEKPSFLNISSVLEPAQRQLEAARAAGYNVEWLVSDSKAVEQLTKYFKDNNISIIVKYLKE